MVRYRFIVARDNPKLYEHLVRSFADVADIEVIVDRRGSERRAARVRRMGRERRLRERRTDARIQEELRLFGWAFMRVEPAAPGAPARPAPAGVDDRPGAVSTIETRRAGPAPDEERR